MADEPSTVPIARVNDAHDGMEGSSDPSCFSQSNTGSKTMPSGRRNHIIIDYLDILNTTWWRIRRRGCVPAAYLCGRLRQRQVARCVQPCYRRHHVVEPQLPVEPARDLQSGATQAGGTRGNRCFASATAKRKSCEKRGRMVSSAPRHQLASHPYRWGTYVDAAG